MPVEQVSILAQLSGQNRRNWIAPLVFGLMASAIVIYLAYRNLSSWPVAVRYPGEISDIEGRPMTEMVLLRQGVPIYAPPSPERYDSGELRSYLL